MKNDNSSKVYARALLELAKDQKFDLAAEMTRVQELINSNNHLEQLLFLDTFTLEEKGSVLMELLAKLNLSATVVNFFRFLLEEKRLSLFPQIYLELMILDDDEKGLIRGVVEGSENQVDPQVIAQMKSYLDKELGKSVELDFRQNLDITAGYRVTVGDLQLDTSLDAQLDELRETILTN
jgi:F-type H+-transporting ATPase subunit delta